MLHRVLACCDTLNIHIHIYLSICPPPLYIGCKPARGRLLETEDYRNAFLSEPAYQPCWIAFVISRKGPPPSNASPIRACMSTRLDQKQMAGRLGNLGLVAEQMD